MKWKTHAERKLQTSGLLEPRNKTAKLRAILPSIEVALANGSSYLECIAYLKTLDVDFTPAYFTVALNRVRKADTKTAKRNAIPETSDEPSAEKQQSAQPKGSRIETKSGSTIVTEWLNGTVISSVEKKDHLTNRIPNIDELV